MLATSMTLAVVACGRGVVISILLPRLTGEGREGASHSDDTRQFLICNLMHLGWGLPPPCLARKTGEGLSFGVSFWREAPKGGLQLAFEQSRTGSFFSSAYFLAAASTIGLMTLSSD